MGWWKSHNDAQNANSDGRNNQKYFSQSQSQTPQSSFHSYYKSYSSSTSCRDDPEDQNFIICNEKVHDGNQAYQNVKRVPKNQYNPFGGFSNFRPIFSGFFNQVNHNDTEHKEQNQFNIDLNRSFGDIQREMQNLMGGFFLPFAFSAFNNSFFPNVAPQANNFNKTYYNQNQDNSYNHSPNNQSYQPRHYDFSRPQFANRNFSQVNNSDRGFSYKQKDTGVRDL